MGRISWWTPTRRIARLRVQVLALKEERDRAAARTAAWEASGREPDLSQFAIERRTFSSDEEQAEYAAAYEHLRQTAKRHGVQHLHARMLAPPTATTLRILAASIDEPREYAEPAQQGDASASRRPGER